MWYNINIEKHKRKKANMGFTRYYEGNVTITEQLVADVEKIVKEAPCAINGWDGTGEPVISLNEIRLNGNELNDESCETFLVNSGDQEWGFCKTAREPYDLVVATILRRIADLNEDFEVSSDGGNDEEAAEAFYNRLFA